MWERTLQDLIRGLRANKKDEAKFITQAVDEIRQEVRSKDMELKAGAVLKLTYLDMLGYDMSWASFHVVEVMSSPRIHLKSVGYLGASQTFDQDTDVLMLTTNLLKKDLNSRPEDVAVTLNGFSQIVTADLARDLAQDVIRMLTHSRASIRKRAVLALYKVLMKYPEATPTAMTRLRERLEDTDPGVVSATINVLCELARHNPQEYLTLAPQLFHLMTNSSNNWMLIKIIKLFGTLTPYEPRLVKKLQPPISDLISTTPAISLLYECVHTCITGGMLQGTTGNALARTCVSKLANFLQDEDQNLKYIALLALVKIVPTHPYLVAEYQDMIMSSINDQDISIRMRALDLISAMANRDNLQSIVQQLLSHLVRTEITPLPSAAESLSQHTSAPASTRRANAPSQSPAYRLTLSQRILALCSQGMYENVSDFEWYLSVLVDLANVASANIGIEIRDQLVDVAARVQGARRYAVQLMVKLLCDDTFLLNAGEDGSCAEVLWAAAWICGEYCGELAEPQKLLTYLLQPRVLTLASETVAVYLQAAIKVFGSWTAELADRWDDDDLAKVRSSVDTVVEQASEFASNSDIEIQERAANILQLLAFVQADLAVFRPKTTVGFEYGEEDATGFGAEPSDEPRFPKSLYLVQPLFNAFDLNPVASSAQEYVPVPEGLDLNTWIVPPPKEDIIVIQDDELTGETKPKKAKKGKRKDTGTKSKGKKRKETAGGVENTLADPVETEEEKAERERRKAERLERQRDDPYYLVDDRSAQPKVQQDDLDSIPVVRLDDLPPLPSSSVSSRLPSLRSTPRVSTPLSFVVDRVGEMPTGAMPLPSPPVSLQRPLSRPSSVGNGPLSAPLPSAFPAYEVEDDIPRTGTPPPIKVVRTKKKPKKTGSSNGKKRTADTGTTQ